MALKLSPGHWHKENSGASSPMLNEVREARRVVARVSQLLTQMKYTHSVIQDNTSKNQVDNLKWLVAQHNKEDGLDVSIHFNAFTPTKSERGVEVYYYDQKELATKISDAIAKAGNFVNRGAKKKDDLYFLAKTKAKAVLIEVCFVDSEGDVKKYHASFEAICIAIAETISGRKYTKPEQPKPTEKPNVTVVPGVKYQVIAGTYENISNADKQVETLKSMGIPAFVQVKK